MKANSLNSRTTRKLLSILVIAAMVITSFSITAISGKAYAAEKTVRTTELDLTKISSTDTQGAVYATDTDTYTCEEEGWTWNASTKVLTLDGTTIDLSEATASDAGSFGLDLPADSTIKLLSDSKVVSGNATGEKNASFAIYADGNLTIDGAGKELAATAGNADYTSCGIYVNNGSLTNTADTSIDCDSGASSDYIAYCIQVSNGNLTNNGSIYAFGVATYDRSYSVSVHGNLINNGEIWAWGEESTDSSYGIRVKSNTSDPDNSGKIINGADGRIAAYGGASERGYSVGMRADNVIENNGEICAYADEAGVDLTGDDDYDSFGIFGGSDIVNNGYMIGYGEKGGDYSIGIYADGNIINNEEATMRGVAESAGEESDAIQAYEDITNSGKMVAIGADEGNAYGICADTMTCKGINSSVMSKAATAAISVYNTLTINEGDGLKLTGAVEKKYESFTDYINETGNGADEYVRIKRPSKYIVTATASKKSIKFTYASVPEGKTYKLHIAKVGTSKWKTIKGLAGGKVANATGLKAGTQYKAYVVVYDKDGNEITSSPYVYVTTTGGNYSNATKVTAPETLEVPHNRKVTLSAKITSKSSSKTLLWKNAGSKIRYYSADSSIATVNKTTGKITPKKIGTVSIYSVAPSGAYAVTTLTVA